MIIGDLCHTTAFHNPHHIRRPQAKGATVKRPAVVRPHIMSAVASSDPAPALAASTGHQPGLDYWRSTADDDAAALDYKREMDRQQREKKKQEKKFAKQFGWWKGEAPYKADRPSNLRAYRASGAYRFKLDSFTDFVQAQASPVRSRKPSSEASPDVRSTSSATPDPVSTASKPQFAPPASYDQDRTSDLPQEADAQNEDDPHARRMFLSQPSIANAHPPPPSAAAAPAPYAAVPPPPPPPTEVLANIPPPPPPAPAPYNPTISAPPVRYNPTISAPPVRYEHATISAPPVRYDIPEQADEPPQERPAKRAKLSKAEAMMAKMGYKKGEGLGKNSDGITTHLEVKARKADKRVADVSDEYDENGKVIKSQQVFDIMGGHTIKQKEPDKFGQESKVIVAWGCMDGIDWSTDADRDDGGVRQEMGQTFDEKVSIPLV